MGWYRHLNKKMARVKLVTSLQTSALREMMWSCTYFPHVSKMATLTYKRANKERYNLEHYIYYI